MGSTRPCRTSVVMGYYDGNTVTALWNYAQHYAMSDNSFGTTFGPSTPGALNLISGQTHGATPANQAGDDSNGTVVGDPDPAFDDCSSGSTVAMHRHEHRRPAEREGHHLGLVRGRLQADVATKDGKAVCGTAHKNVGGAHDHRLHPAPRAVPVLPLDGQPAPPAAVVGRDDRPHRPGQPPVRPERLLGRRRRTATCRRSAS